ncbi:DBD_Tnp_Mut domain-containing protein [Raphanus sativus]|nr:DBD_Tnp_Mut domain-containing protein [Raphanus sativus]
MVHLVRTVVGNWQRLAHGTWRFDVNHSDKKYDLVLKENETYEALVSMVKDKYCVVHSEPVALTYDFPEWMKVTGDFTTPPVDIVEDQDVELFMAVRMDFAGLTLCVVYGSQEVGHYRTIRRDEFGLTEDGTEVVPPKPTPWRGFRKGGYLQVSEEKLMSICTSDQMVEIRRCAVRLTKNEIFRPLEVVDDLSSETGSSDGLEVFTPDEDGMIRLEEVPTEEPAIANLTLAIAITGGASAKGKAIMTEPEIQGSSLFSPRMGSGSGSGNTPGDDVPIGSEPFENPQSEEWEYTPENGHLFVGQYFDDRDEFKTQMALHALANKYRYFVRKSEPGKVVLECTGVNCQWRVYAAKHVGSPRFEIKTLERTHRCTVAERGEFRKHATSSIVGGIMRSKYVGTGTGPRPGALRELMRTDHSVPISYWTAWKSREIAIENGRGKMGGVFKRRRTCSRCGATDHNKVTCKMPI